MKCRDIDRILDEHSESRLSASQRAEFNAHVGACKQCRRAVEAQAMLRAEQLEGPRSGLFEAMSRTAAREATPPVRVSHPSRSWQTLTGLVAVAALVLVAVLVVPDIGRDAPGPVSSDNPDRTAPGRTTEVPSAAALPRFVEGEHYLRIPAQPGATHAAAAAVSVIEFFMYLCNHCYQFEFRFDAWLAQQSPDRVIVTRVPVQWNAAAQLHARAFYAAELLGVTDEIHAPFFEEVHDNGNALATEPELREFFSQFGVDSDRFTAAFHSDTVDAQLDRARRLATEFGIDSTPTVVIDDTYLASPATAGTYDGLIDLVDWLVARVAEACSVAVGDADRPERPCPSGQVP